MLEKVKEHLERVQNFKADSKEAVEAFRIEYLGSKGLLKDLFAKFKEVPADQKKAFGQAINELKQKASDKVNALKNAVEEKSRSC